MGGNGERGRRGNGPGEASRRGCGRRGTGARRGGAAREKERGPDGWAPPVGEREGRGDGGARLGLSGPVWLTMFRVFFFSFLFYLKYK
jgi:hypothetical protein